MCRSFGVKFLFCKLTVSNRLCDYGVRKLDHQLILGDSPVG
uniref:Uncharacterized protein n=1 Tax=Rhizophora mucronata TaxID=61149 RepID=A0A2P2LYQ1_RHIMU